MPRPLNERHFFEQELAEIPGQVAAYRQGLENGRATKARRERLEWQIREREKRGWQKGKATGQHSARHLLLLARYQLLVFDLTQSLTYNPAFVTMQGGLSQAEAALIAGIENDQTYFNIHTMANMGGEIRGQLEPLGSVPEPTTLLLWGSTVTGLALAHRRLRKQA